MSGEEPRRLTGGYPSVEGVLPAGPTVGGASPALRLPLYGAPDVSLDALPEDLRLDDIFDLEETQRIQDAFALAMGVASIITYPDGRPFTRPSNFSRLCADIIRKTERGLHNCMRSDALLGRVDTEGPIVQPCLSGGLIDGGTSIVVGGRHVGNWLIGQVLSGPVDTARMLAYAREIGADEDAYREALAEVTRMPADQFDRIASALFEIARQLSSTGIKNLLLARKVEQLHAAEQQLKRLALYDALTELPNRTLAIDRLQQSIAQAARSGVSVGVLFIDLDRFKQVNDVHGHSVGDSLLREAARRLTGCCRTGDTIARLGGDEFLLLLPALREAEAAQGIAAKIVERLAQPFMIAGQRHWVTASVGIALYPDDGESSERLLMCADTAMYSAKESGRNGFQRFRAVMSRRALRQLSLMEALPQAIERGELFLEYQPIHEIGGSMPVGLEALLRWHSPELGSCEPAELVPIAEEAGLMGLVDRFVLEQACGAAVRWVGASGAAPFLAVNLSTASLGRDAFVDTLADILSRAGLAPARLAIELYEADLATPTQAQLKTLEALSELGVSILIDHYGVGTAGLHKLKHAPVSSLKIDRALVQGLAKDSVDGALVCAIVRLGEKLGLKVIGEGVETQAQADGLCDCGCRLIQGRLISAPLGERDLLAYLRRAAAEG
ncbi:putative bifunctional diguanylate cyclase/phosphodiesterase [Thiorhodococcus minor]|uniref:EAL domain-containing protein n=1 Tax=Thiorhodococcus minor TaxID=57489 RepID=A0A6M0K290_9GAMM|nr:EAL domain-containing protein [Thiorhodococcus minor]NEV63866.1 EAL domain-containing protein [Thiorhodococcus minor]